MIRDSVTMVNLTYVLSSHSVGGDNTWSPNDIESTFGIRRWDLFSTSNGACLTANPLVLIAFLPTNAPAAVALAVGGIGNVSAIVNEISKRGLLGFCYSFGSGLFENIALGRGYSREKSPTLPETLERWCE